MALRLSCALALAGLLLLAACGGGSTGNSTPPAQPAVLTSISPTSVPVGTGATTLQLTGSNFVSGSVATFDGSNLTTTYSSATSLSAVIPASSLGAGGTAEVAVVNPGATASASMAFAIDSPTPVLTSVSPTSVAVGNSSNLTLSGTGFESNSQVQLNGVAVTTTFVSTTSLKANVTATQLSQAGTGQLAVFNPSPGGGTSAALSLQITQPIPVLASVSPVSILAGSGAVPLTLSGSDFSPTASVTANGTALTVTAQTSTSISATLPASFVAQGGSIVLIVTNPGTNPESSSPQMIAAVGMPTVTELSPAAAAIGGPDFTLTVIGGNFQSNCVINWNGTALATTLSAPGQLTATIPAVDIAGFANNTVTISSPYAYPTAGAIASTAQAFSTYLSLPNNDLAYNPADGYLYASVSNSVTGSLGNTIVAIDPFTGNLKRQIVVGSNPNQIAISDDGTQMFVGLDGAGAVRQVNLTTGQPGNQFLLGGSNGVYVPPFTAAALAVLPGEPNSAAVLDISGLVRIFDSGIARPDTSSGLLNTYFDQNNGVLDFGPSAATLYAELQPFGGLEDMTIGSAGITGGTGIDSSTAVGANGFQYDNGRLYLSSGIVLNATTGAQLGTFSTGASQPAVGPVVSDSTLGLAFIGNSSFNTTPAVLAFNESTFDPAGSIPVTGVNGSFAHIFRWGQDGLALSTPTQIYVLQSSVVKNLSSSPADVAVTLAMPAAATTGLALTWTATVTNKGPNAAQGVTLVSTLADSLIVQSTTPTQGSCVGGNEVSCNLGSLASGATAKVTVMADPSVSGTLESTAVVSSESYDPNQSNNQATATTAATGSLYSAAPVVSGISPALVPAGSPTFTLTVNGSGFNPSSTVEINGNAKLTTEVSSTELTATVDAASVATYGWTPVTVSNPAPGGGVSPVTPLTIYASVNVPANAIAFDPFTRKIYATLPSVSTPLTGNSVVAVDPVTGNVGTPIAVGSEPNYMAETSDGAYLYIGLSGAASLGRFNLLTQHLDATIPMVLSPGVYGISGPVTAYGLAAMPGSDTTLAVDLTDLGEAAIFDVSGNTGTFRPNIPSYYTGNNPVFASSTELYTFDNYTTGSQFYRYAVNSQGLTQIDASTLHGLGGETNFPFALANGTVYGVGGGIVNPSTTPPSQIATLSTFDLEGLAVAPDPSTGQDFLILQNSAGTFGYWLYRYDTKQYVADALLTLPVAQNQGELGYDMLRWGQDGLALRLYGDLGNTTNSQILLIRGPFVLPSELTTNAAPALTSSSKTTITVNSGNTVLTLTGSGFLPGAVALWNSSARTTTFVSSSQLTVAISAADVASAGSESVKVQNPGSAASSALTISVQ
jgi:trimeric autotransporter adhesin